MSADRGKNTTEKSVDPGSASVPDNGVASIPGKEAKAVVVFSPSHELFVELRRLFKEIEEDQLLHFPVTVVAAGAQRRMAEVFSADTTLALVELNPANPTEATEYLQFLRSRYPHRQQLVLVSNESLDYLSLAREFDVGNIVLREKLDRSTMAAITRKLLGENFFGFEPFFRNGYSAFNQTWELYGKVSLRNTAETYFQDFLNHLSESERAGFSTYISELVVNALTYGVADVSAEDRDQGRFLQLPATMEVKKNQAIKVHIVQDDEKYAISVIDQRGSLSSNRILYKIRRHKKVGDEELPPGVLDMTGRGLFILSSSNRLVVNVLQGIQTEVILMHFFESDRNKYQPLIINEREPQQGDLRKLIGTD